jgi:hypothetical protein
MRELTRFEMAAVKKTESTIRPMKRRITSNQAKIEVLQNKILDDEAMIEMWDKPVVEMTGGFTSEEVLAGEMEKFAEGDKLVQLEQLGGDESLDEEEYPDPEENEVELNEEQD